MLIKNLDKYPEKLKILEYSKAPYYEYLILKYYGFGVITRDNRLVFCVRDDWLNNKPREPDDSFREILRNRWRFFFYINDDYIYHWKQLWMLCSNFRK